MFQLTHPLPKNEEFYLACSGGIDSVVALYWLAQAKRKPRGLIYVHHNTGIHADEAERSVLVLHDILRIKELCMTKIPAYVAGTGSKEKYWRTERYAFFGEVQRVSSLPIITAHTLDDCVEQYIINTLVRPRKAFTIPYKGPKNTIRPFRMWKKQDIKYFAHRKLIKHVEDPSNVDISFTRNLVRHEIMPKLLQVNPGLYSLVSKQIMLDAKKEPDNLIL